MTPLTAAARNYTPENQESLVKLLLKNGCVVPKDAIHSILLCDLGARCKPTVVRILLEHDADPWSLVAGRRSCLHLALALRPSFDLQCEIAHILVAAGCDPMALDDRGHSPFQLAI
ncbi:hypothetical protein J3R83DRAFT_13588 [Lanmaoa asiatica]|nr:hypothetical protein J3R83DRAFT_13588 [Lanmaoa asiatica]